MFPHTVTLYNVESITDPLTCKDIITNHITLLKNVLVDETKNVAVRMGLSVRTNSLVANDDAALYIPFAVEALDPLSGMKKSFLPPAGFWRTDDKSPFWTLSVGKQKSGPASGASFFIRGMAVHPDLDVSQLESLYGGNLFLVSNVNTMDFGGLQHWEVNAG